MTIRPIARMHFPDVAPGTIQTAPPRFEEVDPRELLVDESYQRGLSERSIALIRRIVANWDWRGFKPPVVVRTRDGLHVLDGQHTAIAAATRGDIAKLPIMVVEAGDVADRAQAFVRQNRDRIAVGPMQLHTALVAAGDEEAVTIQQVCQRAGVRLLAMPPAQGRYAVGDTMAIGSIRTLVRTRYAQGARRVLQICADGMMAPVTASAIKAVDTIIFDGNYANQVSGDDLAVTIRKLGAEAERKASLFAAEHRVPIWRGLVVVLFRETPKVRRGPRAAA